MNQQDEEVIGKMCTSCRGRAYAPPPLPPGAVPPESDPGCSRASELLATPLSRAGLLRLGGAGAGLALAAGSLSALSAASRPLPYVVLFVLDGARPEYFDVPGIPHVRSLIRNGTQFTNAFAGILESETPSGHATIATGSEPRGHGILSFWWANSDDVEVDLFNPDKIRAHDMENIIRRSGVPTIAGRVHARHPQAKVVALSGSKYYAADAIGGPDADIIMYYYGTPQGQFVPTYVPGHAPPAGVLTSPGLTAKKTNLGLGVENYLAMQLAIHTFNHARPQVSLINLPEFDWPLGHVDGGIIDPHGVTALMQSFDRDLAMLQDAYRRAGVLDRTLFVLMADHGMMPLAHKIDSTALAGAITKAGTDIVSQSYSTGAYFWLKDRSKAVPAAQNIANLHNPFIQSIYVKMPSAAGYAYQPVSKAGVRTPGVAASNQYLLHTFAGPNGPDVVTVFAEGVGSEPGGQASWKADHGGTSWESQHLPLILSGPGVRSGVISSSPARLIDVAPTVLQLLGISHHRMHGLVLADALTAPTAHAVQRQRVSNQRLLPLVQHMQQESHLELAAGR